MVFVFVLSSPLCRTNNMTDISINASTTNFE